MQLALVPGVLDFDFVTASAMVQKAQRPFRGNFWGGARAIVGKYLQAWDLRIRQATACARICFLAIAVWRKREYAHSPAVVCAVELDGSAWQWFRVVAGLWVVRRGGQRAASSDKEGSRGESVRCGALALFDPANMRRRIQRKFKHVHHSQGGSVLNTEKRPLRSRNMECLHGCIERWRSSLPMR
ncbi:uncharacterized protein M421DRAFT_159663 [Didymella exigua CBS 183.55]|uniref:Uncharacterized protein n=1 Tax=Didymella exigua CBS 183.55 TaxID=1150837 RepID=A0A6A5RMZ5_9PLEO|nr:uncharacterized protein M421DRAFT_159663 [Didymella exigua CBS 183.55]KAF1928384.1 hypothetical protein M421DRAFT_159663 [Didymella exigua CBS 183.55]